jgi:hypothetical protein
MISGLKIDDILCKSPGGMSGQVAADGDGR